MEISHVEIDARVDGHDALPPALGCGDTASTRVEWFASRALLWVGLLALYAVALFGVGAGDDGRRMDPVGARPRAVEAALAEGRFGDALAMATELSRLHPQEPLVLYWTAAAHRGLDQAPEEAAAWERFVALSPASAAVCPALADAYERAGDRESSIRHHQRCVTMDPGSPERLFDLARAWERAGNAPAAASAIERRAALMSAGIPAAAGGTPRR